jgi:formylmethanofuran dehydrogenase subunit E
MTPSDNQQRRKEHSAHASKVVDGNKKEAEGKLEASHCFACGLNVPSPKEGNHLGDEIICDTCREEMVSSLEEAWVKHSAFLDSALN